MGYPGPQVSRAQRRDSTPAVTQLEYRAVLPLALVVVALIALVLIAIIGQQRTHRLEEYLSRNVEPARVLVTNVHVSLASGSAALHDFLETRDTSFLRHYYEEVRRERAAIRSLSALARILGSDVFTRQADLSSWSARWHARAEKLILADPAMRGSFVSLSEEESYEGTLIAAARLDQAINNAVAARRAKITAAERIEMVSSIAVAFFALAAAAALGVVGRRMRSYAFEAELRRREAEAALASKERLARGVTHDLKNPLNVIDSHAQLLEQGLFGALTAAQAASIDRIRHSVGAQLRYIEDLLELSRVGSEQLRFDLQETDLAALVSDVVMQHEAAANTAGVALICEEIDGGLAPVQTDPDRVRQVLGNLLTNAIKYTGRDGKVVVRTELRSRRRSESPDIAIDVVDSGPGISADLQQVIFEEFTRLDGSGASGSGIGLAIARRVAHLLGGDVTVASAPGQGSTFTLWLPRDGRGG